MKWRLKNRKRKHKYEKRRQQITDIRQNVENLNPMKEDRRWKADDPKQALESANKTHIIEKQTHNSLDIT